MYGKMVQHGCMLRLRNWRQDELSWSTSRRVHGAWTSTHTDNYHPTDDFSQAACGSTKSYLEASGFQHWMNVLAINTGTLYDKSPGTFGTVPASFICLALEYTTPCYSQYLLGDLFWHSSSRIHGIDLSRPGCACARRKPLTLGVTWYYKQPHTNTKK